MAHVEKHHRKPCGRSTCGHGFAKHGKTTKGACTVPGCGCARWITAPGDRETYRLRYRDPAGRERSLSFTRKVDADQRLISIEDSKRRGAYVDPKAGKVAFGEWAERWYKTTAGLKPSTRHYYRQLLDGQVLPAFASSSLAGIDRMMVREWIAGLIDDGPGASRIRGAHAVLSMVLDSAVDANRLATNHAAGVRGLPRRPEVEMHFLTAVEVERLASTMDPRYSTLVRVGAYTGLRPGELVGLKVKRLDLLRGKLEVAEALGEVNGRLVWGTPKNHERRTVRLPRFLADELGAYLADRPSGPEDLVFTAPRGGAIREHKFMEQRFGPAAVRAGLYLTIIRRMVKGEQVEQPASELRMHDLRHTAASLLIREGASIKALQKQLGHKDAVQTLNRYGHLYPDELDSLAERLEAVHERARLAADTDRMRTEHAPAVVQIGKAAGQ
jgi:integrase